MNVVEVDRLLASAELWIQDASTMAFVIPEAWAAWAGICETKNCDHPADHGRECRGAEIVFAGAWVRP